MMDRFSDNVPYGCAQLSEDLQIPLHVIFKLVEHGDIQVDENNHVAPTVVVIERLRGIAEPYELSYHFGSAGTIRLYQRFKAPWNRLRHWAELGIIPSLTVRQAYSKMLCEEMVHSTLDRWLNGPGEIQAIGLDAGND